MATYNLLNMMAFRELPKVIRNLREINDNYVYFNAKSVNIIVDMAVSILNSAADVITNGELNGAGAYIRKNSIKGNITRDSLCEFITNIELARRMISIDNGYSVQD